MYDSFAAVTRGRVELARLSKGTLSDLSHVLEGVLLDGRMPGVVLTGFQVDGNWSAELTRYQRLGEPDVRTVAVFATGDLGDTGEVIGFELPAASGLRQEWFIVVQAEHFSCALFGVDRPEPDVEMPIDEMDRLFDATWTFEPGIIGELSDLVLRVARTSDPAGSDRLEAALRRFPPRTASRELEASFHQRMFATVESGRQRWRRQVVREYLLRQRLQEAEAGLRNLERLAVLGTTSATLAHEINNPLGAITLAAELIDSEVSSLRATIDAEVTPGAGARLDTIASHGRLINDASARVGRLVHGMLDVARTGEIRLEAVELVPWLQRVVEELAVSLTHPVILLGAGEMRVSIDTDRVRHILTNLVRNAIQADLTGDPIEVEVEVEVDVDVDTPGERRIRPARHVTLLVRDHGSGIAAEVVGRLFQPFVTTKIDSGGTGLGLMLAQRFAKECHGTLTLRSTGAAGTVFALALPILGGHDTRPDADAASAQLARNLGADDSGQAPQVALVLDDDPEVRTMLGRMLERLGWHVLLAACSDEAVEILVRQPCDVMLADWGAMADGAGFEVLCGRLESVRPGCTGRMVVITGSLASTLPASVTQVVLPKPFGSRQLQDVIARLIAPSGQ